MFRFGVSYGKQYKRIEWKGPEKWIHHLVFIFTTID